MRLLVTGAAGFIGSNFVRSWLERQPDDHVVAFDLLTYAGNRSSLEDVEDNIVQEKGGHHRVKGLTEIGDFNAVFGTDYSDDDHDTVGGLVMSRAGRVPKRGEQVSFDNLTFKVLRADGRRLHLLEVAKKKQG